MRPSDYIAKHVRDVPPSGIRKFFDIASEMKDAISLGVGEPDFVTPWNVRESAIYSVEKGQTHYTSNRGHTHLREEICTYLAGRFDVHYELNEVLVTVGASEAIDLACRAVLNPGEEVLVPAPSYVAYMPSVMFAGGVPVGVVTKAENGFVMKPEVVEAAITEKTKAIILPYPNNPTGGIMQKEHIEALLPVIQKHDLLVITDEIYAELTYGRRHVSIASYPGMKDRCILINGFSKAFAMTGWRLGYMAAPKELLDGMVKIHQYAIMCAPTMSQAAGIEALRSGRENDYEHVEYMRRQYDRRRKYLLREFRRMGLDCFEPLGAFYVFPCIQKTGLSSEEFCNRLIQEKKVAVVPGTAFGECGEGFVRCSYASSMENLQEAAHRIDAFVKSI
ncbi:MAG: aminotransferase class I/II-fold pyridoxal phosphate-dependent enzyme [Christensenellales bacterium]|jgi:aminotransferase